MKTLNDIFIVFIAKYKTALQFISKNFGEKEILLRKNNGSIKARNLEIRNSQIKGYIFHGSGCDFSFKKDSIDIEFENDNIGFTNWSFYSFVKKINSDISENAIKAFLNEKVNEKVLRFNNEIYELNE